MLYNIESMSETALRSELDRCARQFDVAFTALLLLANPGFPADKRAKTAADAVALIGRYPDDDRYVSGGSIKPERQPLS